jgi:hypothetical protein
MRRAPIELDERVQILVGRVERALDLDQLAVREDVLVLAGKRERLGDARSHLRQRRLDPKPWLLFAGEHGHRLVFVRGGVEVGPSRVDSVLQARHDGGVLLEHVLTRQNSDVVQVGLHPRHELDIGQHVLLDRISLHAQLRYAMHGEEVGRREDERQHHERRESEQHRPSSGRSRAGRRPHHRNLACVFARV